MQHVPIPYVVVVHDATGEAFVLSRRYGLIYSTCPVPLVSEAVHHHDQKWEGWFPSHPDQSPDWAKRHAEKTGKFSWESRNFTAYWPSRFKEWAEAGECPLLHKNTRNPS